MNNKLRFEKKTEILIAISFLLLISIPLNVLAVNNVNSSNNGSSFNILDFWSSEISRVSNTPLNILLGDNRTFIHSNSYTELEYNITEQEIQFDSPNYVDANKSTLRIHGYVLYPEDVEAINPGCLVMHGMWQTALDVYSLAYPYLEKGFIVLCYSHPGYGGSEGPLEATSLANFIYDGDYNRSSYCYLMFCAAIQGLRILENFSIVNNSQIMVTGHSLGGLNAMWLASVVGDRIAGIVPYCALGDFRKMIIYLNLPDSFWNNQNLWLDPIYYLKSQIIPSILWQIGTKDEFFTYKCIKDTYKAAYNTEKYIQIYPNKFHGFLGFENNTQFFIEHIINGGPPPPTITFNNNYQDIVISGNTVRINDLHVDSEVQVQSVHLCIKRDSNWELIMLVSLGMDIWTGNISSLESITDYYFIVNLNENNRTWFSSEIFSISENSHSVPFSELYILYSLSSIILVILLYKSKLSNIVD